MSAAEEQFLEGYPPRKRWNVREFHGLQETGLLRADLRFELIDGEIFEMSPMKPPHATGVRKVQRALEATFGEGYVVSNQLPLTIEDDSEPCPDLSVSEGSVDDFSEEHPATAVLVVEVSDSTLAFDRGRKSAMYAGAGIPEYWIVDLKRRCVEVRRDPVDLPSGGGASLPDYGLVQLFRPGQSLSPLALPDQSIEVDALLPRLKEPGE